MDASLSDRLRAIPVFAGLGEESLRRVASTVVDFDAVPGQMLVEPGYVGAGLFFIEEGRCVVDRKHRSFELGPGEFFGEIALLDDDLVRTARVLADTDVRGLAIARDEFLRILESEPKVCLAMLKVLARRLAEM